MRAAYIERFGGPDSIRYGALPVPAIGPREVLVSAEAMAVNHVDRFVRSAAYRTPVTFPFVIGRDLVGTITAVGADVTQFGTGDRVWCNSLGYAGRQGSFSEYVGVPEDRAYPLPDGIDPVEAVSVLHTLATAYLGLCREGSIATGDTVFIGGAGGGVGSSAVQLAAERGARVLASAAPDDFEWVRSCGADEVFDYHNDAIADLLHERNPSGFDLYWDCSGHHDFVHTIPLMAMRGCIIVAAGLSSADPVPTGALYTHDLSLRGFAISNASVEDLRAAAEFINTSFRTRGVNTRIGRILPLKDAAEAHRLLETESTRALGGKIVIRP
ncbi:NADPH:quinone reductase-like Zn-dependent oxidoreductase [Antricoccus suffuscus]|uniref:NADPH:quinone reductase-like Zn-dependent oxidoreductase n=1 Tax=Antricoccus suffuscus TaxID=1629062 RepID=A0A2T0ZY47_9ACTN|nr:NADPH:quinone reductase [Antricoccus suffuscus]PRZ41008.1 NADPH:quinone reductase-like Zn-dependent oxidoreductase [Antricoccus suffuscus]